MCNTCEGNSTPVACPDGTVYVGSQNGKLLAIKDGKNAWEFPCKADKSVCCGPDGTVYAGEYGGLLHAVKDGKEIWHYTRGGGFLTEPLMTPGGVIVEMDEWLIVDRIKLPRKMSNISGCSISRILSEKSSGSIL